jgi:coenzyme PQQ synthesis protein D (PqqD)
MVHVATSRFRLREQGLEWREVEDRVLALDFSESRYLLVNQTGRTLWGPLTQGATEVELVDTLAERHDVARDRAEADVSAFLAELERRDLLVREEA